jgi:hypothetical protein
VDNLSKSEALSYLENLSMELALKDPVTGALAKSAGNNSLLKQTTLSKLLSDEKVNISEVLRDAVGKINVNGEPFDINVEAFNETALSKVSKSLDGDGIQYGVYADPAFYYDGKSDHVDFPVQIVSLNNGNYTTHEEIFTAPYAADIDEVDDEFNEYIRNLKATTPYPLFAIALEFAGADPEDQGLSKTLAVGPYLGLEGVYLIVERDGWTDEEFELWWTDPDASGLVHKRDMFNGNYHLDASGANVKFPDVDTEGHWYQLGDEYNTVIKLIAINDVFIHALTPWEDDDASGSMHRFYRKEEMYHPVINGVQTGGWAHYKVYDDAFNCETNMRDDNIAIHYYVNGFSSVDEDDPYSEAAVYKITATTIFTLSGGAANYRFETNQAINGKLDDINYRFRYYAQ